MRPELSGAKGEVFEHQTAARPKPAKHGSEPEPKQVKHGNQVIADPLAGCPTKLLISQPDRIVTRHNLENRQEQAGEPAHSAEVLEEAFRTIRSRRAAG
jgi:hypothetical protein